MPETQKVRNKILEYKEQKNMTYQQLALMVGCSSVYVQQVLSGQKTGPSANELILKIVQMFGIK